MDGEAIAGGFSRNTNGYCWAKLFKGYLGEKYRVEVVNNACSGTRVEFILDHFDTLVDETDDLVICMIGTNNRHQYMHTGEKKTREAWGKQFYDNLLKLYAKFQQIDKRVVFMANIPASAENEKDGKDYWRILHMDDINAIYKRAQEKTGFSFISVYDLFTEYLAQRNEKVDKYLSDGLHPNDEGYRVMFSLISKAYHL